MFSKKNRQFLVIITLYTLISILYIIKLFAFDFNTKIIMSFALLAVPIWFYYKNFKKIINKKLWPFYTILFTFHFAVFAFSVQMYQKELLFQIVLFINLLATIFAYFLLQISLLPNYTESTFREVYLIDDNHQNNLEKISSYIQKSFPKFIEVIFEVLLLGVLSALFKYISNDTVSLILQILLIVSISLLNGYLVFKDIDKLPIKKYFKIKQIILMILTTALITVWLMFFDSNSFILALIILFIIFFYYSSINHFLHVTIELNDIIADDTLQNSIEEL